MTFFSTLCTAHLPLALVLAAVTQVGAALLTQVLLAAQHLFLGLPTATALQSHLQTLQTHTNNFIFHCRIIHNLEWMWKTLSGITAGLTTTNSLFGFVLWVM